MTAVARGPGRDLVMFDLDGTLVETAPEIQDAVNDTLASLSLPPVSQQQVEGWIGHGTRRLLARALAFARGADGRDVPGSEDEAIADLFGRHYQQRCGTRSRLYPHALGVLRELRRRSVKLAVVTNKEERFTRAILHRLGVAPLLDHVISGDSLPARKPDPAGLLACMAAFDVCAGRALFVGDSAIDVATARNAGVAIWAVNHGYNGGVPIERDRPDRVLTDLRPLLDRIDV